MDPPGLKRRLTCILATDAVGYSRLVDEDETGALRVLAAHRAVIDGIIAYHDGRIANTAGDSVLAEFGSVVEGVRCAVEIQDALKTRNESLPEAQRMHFRIGINLGEVVVKGDDLLGDGVNVAARLQSIAEPGGILVSSSVYDQITGKLDLGFEDMGEQALKNIARPIRAFSVSGAGGTVRGQPVSRPTAGFEAGDVTAEVTLGWGDQVRCEFYNLQNGSITIVKQTENADGTFAFNTSGPAGGSQVQLVTSGGGAQDTPFLSVPPGTYSITELVPAEWSLRDIVCSSANGESAFIYTGNPDGPQDTFEPGDTTATIYLGAGDGVLCTYVNRKVPHTAIPTLSEWMLMLLGTLLLAGGAVSLRRRVAGRR